MADELTDEQIEAIKRMVPQDHIPTTSYLDLLDDH